MSYSDDVHVHTITSVAKTTSEIAQDSALGYRTHETYRNDRFQNKLWAKHNYQAKYTQKRVRRHFSGWRKVTVKAWIINYRIKEYREKNVFIAFTIDLAWPRACTHWRRTFYNAFIFINMKSISAEEKKLEKSGFLIKVATRSYRPHAEAHVGRLSCRTRNSESTFYCRREHLDIRPIIQKFKNWTYFTCLWTAVAHAKKILST